VPRLSVLRDHLALRIAFLRHHCCSRTTFIVRPINATSF
jgi:hypothetical protein